MASSSVASSSAASSEASSSGASSSKASQSSSEQKLSECYIPLKIVTTFNDGATQTTACKYDEKGKQLEGTFELATPEKTYKISDTYTDWDEFGHTLKYDESCDYDDGNPFSTTVESTAMDVNDNGFVTSDSYTTKINKDSFEEGEIVTEKRTETVEYGNDESIIRKLESVFEDFDQSGNKIATSTKTFVYDENGLQTAYLEKLVDADGAEQSMTMDITWTLDDNGKPTSYQTVQTLTGEDPVTTTGDVTLNEQGLITKVSNVKVNGEAYSTTAEVTYEKHDNPLQNAYEGWKSLTLTNLIISLI